MQPKFACDVCQKTFTRGSDLRRHHANVHTKTQHECKDCGKSFSRLDALKRHQQKCRQITFKCPRCTRSFGDMTSFTDHLDLCPMPTCADCPQSFTGLIQLKEHQKSHKKRKASGNTTPNKKRRTENQFRCGVCEQLFTTRQLLFQHKLTHLEDSSAFEPVTPHIDFEDKDLRQLLESNQDHIFAPHRFTALSTDYSFPIMSLVTNQQWTDQIHHRLDCVADIEREQAFKINFSVGVVLIHRENGEYRFFTPHHNNAFFKTPKRIDRPSSWRGVYNDLTDDTLTTYIMNHRDDTKWIPIMLTHVVVHLYHLGVTMGSGELPDYIKTLKSVVPLDRNREKMGAPLYEDSDCALRALAYHYNVKEHGDGFKNLDVRMKKLKQHWKRDGLELNKVQEFEDIFKISIDIYSYSEDGGIIPRYLTTNTHEDRMTLNLFDTHLSYVSNVEAYLQKYQCASCGRHFDYLSHWKRHRGTCANATQYEFPGRFHKMNSTIFDRLEEFNIIVPENERVFKWFVVYDFEAVLSHIDDQQTARLKWLRRHDPISVSVSSNVDGFREPRGFVNKDSKALIESMMEYIGSISDQVYENAQATWSSVITTLDSILETHNKNLQDLQVKLEEEPKKYEDLKNHSEQTLKKLNRL